jgi:hypothetical protein
MSDDQFSGLVKVGAGLYVIKNMALKGFTPL